MDTTQQQRIRDAKETLEILRQTHPRNNPDAEAIARLHELHARHERARGREDVAAAAEERAWRVRERASHQGEFLA